MNYPGQISNEIKKYFPTDKVDLKETISITQTTLVIEWQKQWQ